MGFWNKRKKNKIIPKCSKCGRKDTEVGLLEIDNELLCLECLRPKKANPQRDGVEAKKLKRKIKKNPQDPQNYYNLGALIIPDEYHKEDYESSDSEVCYDLLLKALAAGLSDPIQRGRAYFRLAVLKGGWTWKNPRDNSMELRSVTLLGKQHLRSAAKEFKLALSYDPDNIEVLKQLQVVYRTLEREDELGEISARLEEVEMRKRIGSPLASRKARLSSSQKGLTFEHKCMQVIQSMGFSARTTKTVADGGIDIVAVSNQPLTRGKYIVQCKNWRKPVGEPIVRDLYGVVSSDNAVKGILISSSGFTASAIDFAKDKRLELIDGDQFDYLSSLATKK